MVVRASVSNEIAVTGWRKAHGNVDPWLRDVPSGNSGDQHLALLHIKYNAAGGAGSSLSVGSAGITAWQMANKWLDIYVGATFEKQSHHLHVTLLCCSHQILQVTLRSRLRMRQSKRRAFVGMNFTILAEGNTRALAIALERAGMD